MSRHAFFFGLFCLAVLGGFAAATQTAYSPFADGGPRASVHGFYGPAHK